MKKLFFLATMMLLSLSAGAQKIDGVWTLNKEFSNAINEIVKSEVKEADLDMEYGLSFSGTEVKFMIWINASAESMTVKMNCWTPGTYTRTGNHVVCDFNVDKTELEIIDFTSDDPELEEVLSDPASKAMVLAMMKGQMKQQMGGYMSSMSEISDQFKEFDVVSANEAKLVANFDDVEISFDRR